MRKILLATVMLLSTLVMHAYGQSRVVTGKVTALEDGSGLIGVTVRAVGSTAVGTTTNQDGSYSLNVPSSVKSLSFSFVGFKTSVLDIPANNVVNVSLEVNQSDLNEVVVTAGGLTAQRRELGTQATTIKNTEITQGKAANLAAGLSGKVPGLLISAVSSGLNPNYRLVLRGNRSLTGNNQALVIIDNIISPNSILGNLNPEDIEDIQVLNGAGAAALYGSDASNGALIVTTKKGKAGRTEVKIAHTTTLEKVSFLPQLQKQFGSGTTPDDVPSYTPYENQQYGPAFDGSMVNIGKPLQDGSIQSVPYSYKGSREDFWETGVQNQTDFSISSGDEKSTYYISGQFFDQKSTVPYDKYQRYSVRANSTRKISDKLTATFNTNFIANRYDQSSQAATVYQNLLMSPGQVDVTQYSDWRNNPFANPNGYYNEYYTNPYFTLENNRVNTRNDYFQGNVELKWNPIKPLSITYRVGLSTRNVSNKSTVGKFTFTDYTKSISGSSKTDIPGSVGDYSGFNTQLVNDLIAQYNTSLGSNFSLNVVAGISSRDNSSKDVSVGASGLVISDLYNVGNSLNNPTAGESNFKARQLGVYGDVRLGFKEYLYLHVTGRNDWRSVLAKDNRSFFYPAADLSFIASDAIPALSQSNWLQSLKLRGGYSKVGQVNLGNFTNFGAYALATTFSQAYGYPYASGAGFTLGNTLVASNIKPEMTTGAEVGFDFELKKLGINGGITLYKTNTVDQTITVNVSSASGFSSLRTNVGEVQNKGLESYLNITPIRTASGFEVSLGANYTYNQNEVISLADQLNELVLSSVGTASRVLAKKGSPFPLLQVTTYNRDPQGRIIVDPTTGYPASNGTFSDLGITTPPHVLGLNTGIKYKGLRLSALFEYRNGHYIYNAISTGYDFSGAGIRTAWYNRDRFVIPNSSYQTADGNYVANNNIAVRSGGADFWTDGTRNTSIGENYANSAGFWKLRELVVAYNFPASILSKANFIKAATVSVQGRNLFIWVPKTNLYTDPEYSANGTDSNAVGITNLGQTPPARYFGGTLSLTF
ncbi:SusC/RagA family TonB-linked outer membrane protein [Siphonobacter sp. BAB-5385]|uniref:SusC/RagA family TonB-linked outer membrane protein n=1 Tax=Siphonobacter sp. BAB-5385 TaxID=1864822 RepID=UPI000B9E9AA5|nr:SusC/RagA family TonB-linked outer membrane protein [Siphonobacter sp. BAB-5385]OZI07793.1 SusC/RagA family TonB-linked outer membrane protein [Siphonobacter sp. BAB-5385]